MKILIILNRKSGISSSARKNNTLEKLLKKYGIIYDIHNIKGNDIKSVVKNNIDKGYDAFVAAGGDGTINALVNSLKGRNIPLGIIPLGTFNHFAKDNNIPLTLNDSVKNLIEGQTKPIDTAKVNNRIFINNSSLGIYTRIVRIRELYEKSGFSKIRAMTKTFSSVVFKVLFNLPQYHFKIKTEDIDREVITPFIFIGNNEYIINKAFRFGRRENLNTGKMSLYYLDCGNNDSLINAVWKAYNNNPNTQEEFSYTKHTKIHITNMNQEISHITVDGEVFKMSSDLDYEIIPKSLYVIKP